jgi:hypothetical protein
MKFFTAIVSVLALAVSTTTATPIDARAELIVVTPHITAPADGDVWTVGSEQLVQWDTSEIPDQAKSQTGTIVLGFDDGTGSENLDYGKLPVASSLFTRGDWKTYFVCDPPTPHRKPARAGLFADGW